MAVGWMTLGDWKVGPQLLKCVPQGWLRGGGGIQAQGRGLLPRPPGTLRLAWVPWDLSWTLRMLALESCLPTPWRLHRSCGPESLLQCDLSPDHWLPAPRPGVTTGGNQRLMPGISLPFPPFFCWPRIFIHSFVGLLE